VIGWFGWLFSVFKAVACVVGEFVMLLWGWGICLVVMGSLFVEVPMGAIVEVGETGFQPRL